jgi:hypothetical protein
MAATEYLPKKQQKINKIMEKERKIEAPEGCEIEKVELIDGAAVVTFREKERKLPKSWEEFCKMFPMKIPYNFAVKRSDLMADDFIFLNSYHNRLLEDMGKYTGDHATAKAVLALCKLIQLRNAYNGEWVPDWNNKGQNKYTITIIGNKIKADCVICCTNILYFKSAELRDEFLRYFRPLIEKLKPLYGIKEGGEE